MLSLTRKPGESVFLKDLDGDILVEVKVNVQNGKAGNQVSLGFRARKDIDIAREELLSPVEVESFREKVR